VRAIKGYDEYYRIWGFEDKDLARRLTELGISTHWINDQNPPLYHQWHPPANTHYFMQWWWDDMTLYEKLEKPHTMPDHFGARMPCEERPLSLAKETIEYFCPTAMNSFERRQCIMDILDLLCTSPGKKIIVETGIELAAMSTSKNQPRTIPVRLSNGINRFMRSVGSTMQLRLEDSSRYQNSSSLLYFFYQLIFKSDLLRDYAIDELPDRYRFHLLSKT
jgi:hypothetical protein